MSARQGVHRPAWNILQLVVEPGEARRLRGQDVHLPCDATNVAGQPNGLGEGGERVRSTFALPERDHVGMFKAELSRRSWRCQPILTRHRGWTPIGRQYAEIGLSVLRHEGVEVDQ